VAALLARAHAGDASALPALRALLDGRPDLWRRYGDLPGFAEKALLDLAAGRSLVARESIARRLAELKAELLGPAPGPAERLVADRAAAGWLGVYLAELEAADARRAGCPAPRARLAEERLSRAQARYLAALRQLATLGRLLRAAPSPADLAARHVSEGPAPGGRAPCGPRARAAGIAN
jgi:hypothetical protein